MLYFPRFVLLILLFVSLGGCVGLKRGVDGSTYVSTAKPAFATSVPSLPLRTGGQFTASVTAEDSLGGVTVDAWIAVYGGRTMDEPLAIVAQAALPNRYYWDADLSRVFSIDKGVAVLGDMGFGACTYIVHGADDAFSTLVSGTEIAEMRWIVRRFAVRTDFNAGKITLEYREKLPEDIATLDNLPQGGLTFVRDFEERAMKAFVFGVVPSTASSIASAYAKGIRTRYLNTNFFGTMSAYNVFD